MINETNTVYEVIQQYWIDMHNICMESNPTRKSLTLGQIFCNGAYYQACNGLNFALGQIDLLVNGNPNSVGKSSDINKLSVKELSSQYESTNLDFYETALMFRSTRITELNEQVRLNELIKERIELFAQTIGWSLSYNKKSNVKSKESVKQVITYNQSQIDAVSEELASKGLLSTKR